VPTPSSPPRQPTLRSITQLLVLVPARDEAVSLPRCLDSRPKARGRVEAPVGVVLLDSCTDGCERAAAGAEASVCVSYRTVDASRAAGFGTVAQCSPSARTWLACADADCAVGEDWLAGHRASARAGARGMRTVTADD